MTHTTEQLTEGTRIYNHGDMANAAHFATVIRVKTDRWGTQYKVMPDVEAEREAYWISAALVSGEYLGHGGTRIVTERAYGKWHVKQLQALRESQLKL